MNLLVYLPSAQALSFEDVEIQIDDFNLLVFTYRSKSDGITRMAKFYTKNMVGYATYPGKDRADDIPF